MRRRFLREVAVLGLPPGPGPEVDLGIVGDDDLRPLPDTAQHRLRFHLLALDGCWYSPEAGATPHDASHRREPA